MDTMHLFLLSVVCISMVLFVYLLLLISASPKYKAGAAAAQERRQAQVKKHYYMLTFATKQPSGHVIYQQTFVGMQLQRLDILDITVAARDMLPGAFLLHATYLGHMTRKQFDPKDTMDFVYMDYSDPEPKPKATAPTLPPLPKARPRHLHLVKFKGDKA